MSCSYTITFLTFATYTTKSKSQLRHNFLKTSFRIMMGIFSKHDQGTGHKKIRKKCFKKVTPQCFVFLLMVSLAVLTSVSESRTRTWGSIAFCRNWRNRKRFFSSSLFASAILKYFIFYCFSFLSIKIEIILFRADLSNEIAATYVAALMYGSYTSVALQKWSSKVQ